MADDFATYARRIERLNKALSGPDKRKVLTRLGVEAKKDVAEAIKSDLGDLSMSNWRRGRPINITSRFDIKSDDTLEVTPSPRARGPMRVLEEGRRGGSASDLVQGRRTKSGNRRRGRARGRNQGATAAKNTWSDAERLIADRTPQRVDQAHQQALRAAFD